MLPDADNRVRGGCDASEIIGRVLGLALSLSYPIAASATTVTPGQTFQSEIDLSNSVIVSPQPHVFNTYAVDLNFDASAPWVSGTSIYLELRGPSDEVWGGITIAQPFPFDTDNISGIDIDITPLNGVDQLVGYLLLTSIDASFELLTSSGYFSLNGSSPSTSSNPRIRSPFVAEPYNAPKPDFPTWGEDGVPAVPLPATLPLFATGLCVMGLLGRRKWKTKVLAAA
jgi:hypothetical protein